MGATTFTLPDMADTPTPLPQQPEGPSEDQLIAGHSYDGIKEYDNPMPRWWVGMFWLTGLFAVAYVPLVHFTDVIDTYQADLAEQTAALNARRAAYEAANPTFEASDEALESFVASASAAEAGAVTYASVCAACHGAQGEGLIGPNLADTYWLHGPSNLDIFNVITHGELEKGMPAWEAALSAEERANLVSYVRSLAGTDPPGAKEPQGELYVPPAE